MKKEQFINSFEAQVQVVADKMSVAGDAPEAFHCAAVAQLFFECLKEADIGLLDFEPCSYYADASPGQGERYRRKVRYREGFPILQASHCQYG